MKQWKRLFYYLLLNVLVTTCTMLAVLTYWERSHGALPVSVSGIIAGLANPRTPVPTPAVTQAPAAPTATPLVLVYTVKEGDSLESIAAMYDLTSEELRAENPGLEAGSLTAGVQVRIPLEPPGRGASVVIDRVVGVGDLSSEHVLLRHAGEGELSLVGWRLEDEDGHVFPFPEFPQLTLYKDGAVNVMSRTGTNTVVDLYWGLEEAAWERGELVTLRNAAGEVGDTYRIP